MQQRWQQMRKSWQYNFRRLSSMIHKCHIPDTSEEMIVADGGSIEGDMETSYEGRLELQYHYGNEFPTNGNEYPYEFGTHCHSQSALNRSYSSYFTAKVVKPWVLVNQKITITKKAICSWRMAIKPIIAPVAIARFLVVEGRIHEKQATRMLLDRLCEAKLMIRSW